MPETSAAGGVFDETIFVIMNEQYPRLSFRLTPTLQRRIQFLSRKMNKSQGHVVRAALNIYFNSTNSNSETTSSYSRDETQI